MEGNEEERSGLTKCDENRRNPPSSSKKIEKGKEAQRRGGSRVGSRGGRKSKSEARSKEVGE